MLPLARSDFHIVLFEPEIPANTGNIGRLCVATGSCLHLIHPCRFLLTDKALKRAGLDYWPDLSVVHHQSQTEAFSQFAADRVFLCSTKSELSYLDVNYQPGDAFVFGPESRGLPATLLEQYQGQVITIPMQPLCRSLNLANSVAIILFEAIRQTSRTGI